MLRSVKTGDLASYDGQGDYMADSNAMSLPKRHIKATSPKYNDIVNMMFDRSEHLSMIDQESLIGPSNCSEPNLGFTMETDKRTFQ